MSVSMNRLTYESGLSNVSKLAENDELCMRGVTNSPAQNTYAHILPEKTHQKTSSEDEEQHLVGLIDWVQCSLPIDHFNEMLALDLLYYHFDLPRDPESWERNRLKLRGYKQSISYHNIAIFYDSADEKNGIILSFSGQGCRQAELLFRPGHSWSTFIQSIFDASGRFTRIDLAIDDFYGYFEIPYLIEKFHRGELISRFNEFEPKSKFDREGNSKGWTFAYGSMRSRTYIYMYEKNKEQGVDYFWNRTEIRLKDENADTIAAIISDFGDESARIGMYAMGIINNYISYRIKTSDSNKSRWPVDPVWQKYLNDIPKLRISKPLPDACIERTEAWLQRQVSKSIAKMYYAMMDEQNPTRFDWFRKLFVEGASKLTDEDWRQINRYRDMYKKPRMEDI